MDDGGAGEIGEAFQQSAQGRAAPAPVALDGVDRRREHQREDHERPVLHALGDGATIQLAVAFLPAIALYLVHGHAVDPCRGQGGAHLFHGKGFDDRFDLLHGSLYSSVQGLLEITDSHCPASHGRYRQRSP